MKGEGEGLKFGESLEGVSSPEVLQQAEQEEVASAQPPRVEVLRVGPVPETPAETLQHEPIANQPEAIPVLTIADISRPLEDVSAFEDQNNERIGQTGAQ